MAAYAMMESYDTHPSVRPYTRRAVTAPDTPAKAAKASQTRPALPKHAETFTSRTDKDHSPQQEFILLNEADLQVTDSLCPLAKSIRTPSALPEQGNIREPEVRMLAPTADATAVVVPAEHLTPGAMSTLHRNAYATVKDLCLDLEKHSLFHTHTDTNAVTLLYIYDLPSSEYNKLSEILAPLLEGFRIHIDFQDTTLIMRRPSQTHESGVGSWKNLIDLLETQMPMPPELKSEITWNRGQPDVELPPLSINGRRIKCPDACLGPKDEDIPTLVLETGYSQTPGQVHNVAKTWLHRLIKDGIEALEDDAVQCVILLKINENLSKYWLPAFRESLERQDFNFNQELVPDPTTFVSKTALQSAALTVEIWRNEKDGSTGALKCEYTVRNRPTCTIPVCISSHNITTAQLFDTWIWEYLSEVRAGTDSIFRDLQDHPPIPRSTISTDRQNKYFTLYLDDLMSPKDIVQNRRGTIWVNVPIKLWVWGYLRSQKVGSKGWKRGPVRNVEDVWARWGNENKENREAITEMEKEGSVLGELEVEIDQTRVKRRRVKKGM